MNEEDIASKIGKNIKEWEKKKGISQSKLSQATGIRTSQLSEYENGKKCPNVSSLANIAEGLGVSLDDLYYGPSSTRPITTAHNEAEEIANCIAFLADLGILEIQAYSYRAENGYKESTQLVVCKHEEELKDLVSSLEIFKSKLPDYPDPEIVKKNILSVAAKHLERLIEEESQVDEDLPF